jgi:3,4-dihydroxy-2-butanone 4-phosphate synthase
VSYQQWALDMLLYDVIDTAVKILSLESFRYDIELIGDDLETEHIGQDLYDDIDNTLSKINQVIMKFGDERENTIKIDVQHVDTGIEITDEGSFKVTNIVKPIKGYFCYGDNNNKCDEVSVNDAVEQYLFARRRRLYDDSDYNYISIDVLMDTYTAFTDGDQVIFVLTQFV